MTIRCASCGDEVACEPDGDCWCKELPPVRTLQKTATCLCKKCLQVSSIAETALLTAAFRARESARPDALFLDPFARMLAGDRGAALADGAAGPEFWEYAVAVRTRVIDDLLMGLFAEHQISAVIDIGAGLDARAYRLSIPADVRWIEMDEASTLAYKESILKPFTPQCKIERVAADIAAVQPRREVLSSIGAPCVILTEGVLSYLPAQVVAELASDCRQAESVRWWILDHGTSTDVELISRAWNISDLALTPARGFAPEDVAAFFAQHGWSVTRSYRSRESAVALDRVVPRSALAELVPLMPPVREDRHANSGCVLLEPRPPAEPVEGLT